MHYVLAEVRQTSNQALPMAPYSVSLLQPTAAVGHPCVVWCGAQPSPACSSCAGARTLLHTS